MRSFTVNIKRWFAWAPGVETPSQWVDWANGSLNISHEGVPTLDFLSPMFKRRLSRTGRMTLKVAYECCKDKSIRTIFCSRHGESNRTIKLLEAIATNEPVSPNSFSLSVHNASSGLYSIAQGNTSATTSLSAGHNTLEAGFIEAYATLMTDPLEKEIMLVTTEDPPQAPLNHLVEEKVAFAAAFLITSNNVVDDSIGNDNHTVSLETITTGVPTSHDEPHALSFLQFLLRDDTELIIPSTRISWRWRKYV